MNTVFVLQHSYQLDDESFSDETKFIGVYSSKEEAEAAVQRLRMQPGFDSLPEYFCISPYEVNADHWTEGFVTERLVPRFSVWRKSENGEIRLVASGLVEADALRQVREMIGKDESAEVWACEDA